MVRVVVAAPAKNDIQSNHDWWAENRSAEQAARWYTDIYRAIASLAQRPDRCSFAPERELMEQGVRQLLFGLNRSRTHRIVFVIDGDAVVVLRVRHTAQDALTPDDLA